MVEYFQYLAEMVKAFFRDLGRFFGNLFAGPWRGVKGNFQNYHYLFEEFSPGFGFFGWVFYIIFLLNLIML